LYQYTGQQAQTQFFLFSAVVLRSLVERCARQYLCLTIYNRKTTCLASNKKYYKPSLIMFMRYLHLAILAITAASSALSQSAPASADMHLISADYEALISADYEAVKAQLDYFSSSSGQYEKYRGSATRESVTRLR
jgi:hypothetical protein